MIPRINHSRSRLVSHLNPYDDGTFSLFVSKDIYPELFDLRFPGIVQQLPKGWRMSPKGMKFLWFPQLSEPDVAAIEEWQERFSKYVLLGLNPHLEDAFSDQLDFCLALDFTYDPVSERRTLFGEAEYQAKYQQSHQHLQVLGHALLDAVSDLPIPVASQDGYCLSCIPAIRDERTIPRRLATGLANRVGRQFIDARLTEPKAKLKNATLAEKIPLWRDIYARGCVELGSSVADRLVVVVDDLYQSGATMWAYAEFLKSQGAAFVIGLVGVKSLRDSDNSPP